MDQGTSIPVIRCRACDALAIPPQYVCDTCGGTGFDRAEISGRARVYSHTMIRVAPEAFRDQVPYSIVVMDLAQKLRVTARVNPCGDNRIEVGQELVFDRLDENNVYWFRAVS